MDDIIIYGDGIILAHEAESKQAKYPRIILTESAKAMLMDIDKSFKDQDRNNYIDDFFCIDSDKLFFINYLESIRMGDDDCQFIESLEKHKNIVISKLNEHQDESCIFEKNQWVEQYHNFFCNQRSCYNKYKINSTLRLIQPYKGYKKTRN